MAIKRSFFQSEVSAKIENFEVPVGSVHAYTDLSLPTGYLECNGASLLRVDYPALFAKIGTAFGAASINHFNLPDIKGRFIRGLDGSANRDPDKASRAAQCPGGNTGNAIGSIQAESAKVHNHSIAHNHGTITGSADSHYHCWILNGEVDTSLTASNYVGQFDGYVDGALEEYYLAAHICPATIGKSSCDIHTHPICFTATGNSGNAGNSEDRPVNVYTNFMIKY